MFKVNRNYKFLIGIFLTLFIASGLYVNALNSETYIVDFIDKIMGSGISMEDTILTQSNSFNIVSLSSNPIKLIPETKISGYSWKAVGSNFTIYFKNNSNEDSAIRFQKDGYVFTYDLLSGGLQWKGKVGQPNAWNTLGGDFSSNSLNTQIAVSENKVTYPLAYSFTNLTYEVSESSVKENFVLTSKPTIKDYLYLEYQGKITFNSSLKICANNRCYTSSGTQDDFETQGNIDFRNSANQTIYSLRAPVAIDSKGNKVNLTYKVHGSNAQMTFWLWIPQSFINSSVYPIYIDPTIDVYQADKLLSYNYEYGQTNFTLLKSNSIINDVFVYWNNTKWKFGAIDNSMVDGQLANFTYYINSSQRLILIPHITNETYIINRTANYTIYENYPVIYNFNQNSSLPFGSNEVRQVYSFKDICSKNYSDCKWQLDNESKNMWITFTSDKNIDPDVTNVSSCTTITSPGYYQLNTSIISPSEQDCIVISGTDDVILDLNNKNISGTGGTSEGVILDLKAVETAPDNITIMNGIIKDFYKGIYYQYYDYAISNLTLKNLIINPSGTGGSGINFGGSARSLLADNITINKGDYGVYVLGNMFNSNFSNLNILDPRIGGFKLDGDGVSDCNIKNIYIDGNDGGADTGFYLYSSTNTKVDNITVKTFYSNMYIYGASNGTFSNLNLYGCFDDGGCGAAVYLDSFYYGTKNTFTNITIEDSLSDNIALNSVSNATFNNIYTSNGGYLFYITTDTNYNIFNNVHSNGNYGTYLDGNYNTFSNMTINGSNGDALFLANGNYNTFSNMTITNTADGYGYWDLNTLGNTINNTLFRDSYIESYFIQTPTIFAFEDTGEGLINFTDVISGTGANLSSTINIKHNYVYVNESELDNSADITFYNMPQNFVDPVILRNGEVCAPEICSAYNPLNDETVSFSVTGFSNYTIGEAPDSTAPVVIFNAPPTPDDSSTVTNQSIIEVSVTELNLDLVWVDFGLEINYSLTCLGTTPNYTCNISLENIPDGSYIYNVYANDSLNNIGSSDTGARTISINSTAPTFNIVLPVQDGIYNLATYIPSYTTNDDVNNICQYSYDNGTNWISETCAVMTTVSYVPNEGANQLLINVTSNAGISTLSEEIDFIYDTTAPGIYESAAVITPINDNTPEYIFNSDQNGTIIYGGSCTSETSEAVVGDNAINFTELVDGTYSDCTIIVNDSAGNPSNELPVSEFIVDITPPYFTTLPENAELTLGDSYSGIAIAADDTSGLDSYAINDTDNFNIDIYGNIANSVELGVRLYWLNVSVTDLAGNINSTEFYVNVSAFLDLTAPEVSIIYPENITYNINVSSLNYTASDANLQACWYSLNNGVTNTTVACGTNLTGLTSIEGSNTWNVWANDTSNNVNSSSVTFVKDTIYPIFSNYIDNNASLVGSGLARFNVSILNTNGTVGMQINGTNYTATNLTASMYNVSVSLNNGTYSYYWYSYGNGTNNNYNSSEIRYYTVNSTPFNQISSCQVLNQANTVYTQTADIIPTENVCINITAQNITFDCNGKWIYNITHTEISNPVGIYSNQYNTTIKNCNLTIQSSTVDDNPKTGYEIQLVNANNSYVYNTILNNPKYGLYLLSTSNSILENLTSRSSGGSVGAGIYLGSNSNNNLLTNITSNTNPGISISSSNSNNLTNIILNSNTNEGIYLSSSTNNILTNITANSNKWGVRLYSSTGNIIQNSSINGSTDSGISFESNSNNNFIMNNLLSSSQRGIYLSSTSNTIIDNNTLTGNVYGLIIADLSENNTVQNNFFTYNTDDSISISSSDIPTSNYNLFINNFINATSDTQNDGAVRIGLSSHNLFMDSVFITNTSKIVHIYSSSINNTFLNVTYNTSKESVDSYIPQESIGGGELIRKWYYSANVTDTSGISVSGVNVTAYNVTNAYNFNLTTGINGLTSLAQITDYININGTRNYYSNYTLYANNLTYIVNHQRNVTNLTNIYGDVFTLSAPVDTTFPQMNLTYPLNTTYNANVSELNYTASDANLQACWYSLNNGADNTTVACGTNLTGLTSAQGSNTWTVWANDTSGNVNFSSVTFYKDTLVPYFIDGTPGNISIYTNQSAGQQINATDNLVFGTFSINDTVNFNINSTGYFKNITGLSVGLYWINVTINDTSNNINSSIFYVNVSASIILDTTPPYFTTIPVDSSIVYKDNFGVLFQATDNIALDSYSVNNTNFIINSTGFLTNNTILGVGVYHINVTINDTSNNLNSTIYTLTITPKDLIFTANVTSPIIYGTPSNYTGTVVGGEASCTPELFRNGISLGYSWNPTDTEVLGVGTYIYNFSVTNCVNYTNSEDIQTLIVTQASSSVQSFINNIRNNFSSTDILSKNIYLNGSLITGAGEIQLYLNGTLINSGSSPLFNITNLSVGYYNFSTVYQSTQNYSYSDETFWINVTATPPGTIFVNSMNPLQNYISNTYSVDFSFNITETIATVCKLVVDTVLRNQTISVLPDTITNLSYNFTLAEAPGVHNWYIVCTDASSYNYYSEIRQFTFYDIFLPTVTITYPHNLDNLVQTYTGANFSSRLDYTITDANGPISSAWWSNNDGLTNNTISNVDILAGTTLMQWFQASETTQNYNITLWANDSNNNIDSDNINMNVTMVKSSGGGGGGGTLYGYDIPLNNIIIDMPTTWVNGIPEIVTVRAYDNNGNLTDVSIITIEVVNTTLISVQATPITRVSTGVYQKTFIANNLTADAFNNQEYTVLATVTDVVKNLQASKTFTLIPLDNWYKFKKNLFDNISSGFYRVIEFIAKYLWVLIAMILITLLLLILLAYLRKKKKPQGNRSYYAAYVNKQPF